MTFVNWVLACWTECKKGWKAHILGIHCLWRHIKILLNDLVFFIVDIKSVFYIKRHLLLSWWYCLTFQTYGLNILFVSKSLSPLAWPAYFKQLSFKVWKDLLETTLLFGRKTTIQKGCFFLSFAIVSYIYFLWFRYYLKLKIYSDNLLSIYSLWHF